MTDTGILKHVTVWSQHGPCSVSFTGLYSLETLLADIERSYVQRSAWFPKEQEAIYADLRRQARRLFLHVGRN